MPFAWDEYKVSGPFHYPGDLHECFRIDGPEGVIASVYAPDSLEAAERRANTMAAALRLVSQRME